MTVVAALRLERGLDGREWAARARESARVEAEVVPHARVGARREQLPHEPGVAAPRGRVQRRRARRARDARAPAVPLAEPVEQRIGYSRCEGSQSFCDTSLLTWPSR